MYLITVDTLSQCSIKDTECLKGAYQHMMNTLGGIGDKELGIPPLDPMKINDISLNIVKDLTITIGEGTIKGMKNCVFNSFM